jgi:8-oxo-dGTP pyrophosphatase MutT (NUDIX family)
MPGAPDHPVIRITHLDLRLVPKAWAFAQERRGEIDAYFERLRSEKPALWNGRVLVLHRHEISGATLRGAFLETDFASFIAWRDWDFPDRATRNCFADAAIVGADGAFLLGEMGSHTANAGLVYFPGGTPDPSDVVEDRVDMESSVVRELAEETGLTGNELRAEPHWFAVLAERRIALIKLFRSSEPAAALRERVRRHIAADPDAELADARIIRGAADLDAGMPSFVRAFLNRYWSENGEATA